MIKDSPYTQIKTRKDRLLNTGHDYSNDIMKRTLSNVILQKDGMFSEYLQKINNIIYEIIESVKNIKIFANVAADKSERRII